MGPAAISVEARTQIRPAAATIGHEALDRRRLTWNRAASDEIRGGLPGMRRQVAAREVRV
jgi:hypothetical protein